MIFLIDDPKLTKGKHWAEVWIKDNSGTEMDLKCLRNAIICITPGATEVLDYSDEDNSNYK